jgi:hypothetical protein
MRFDKLYFIKVNKGIWPIPGTLIFATGIPNGCENSTCIFD